MINVKIINFQNPYLNQNKRINQYNRNTIAIKNDCFQYKANNKQIKFKGFFQNNVHDFGKIFEYSDLIKKLRADQQPDIIAEGLRQFSAIPIGKEINSILLFDKKHLFPELREKAFNLLGYLDDENPNHNGAKMVFIERVLTTSPPICLTNNAANRSYEKGFELSIDKFCELPEKYYSDFKEYMVKKVYNIMHYGKSSNQPVLLSQDIIKIYSKVSENKNYHDIIITNLKDLTKNKDSIYLTCWDSDEDLNKICKNIPELKNTIDELKKRIDVKKHRLDWL